MHHIYTPIITLFFIIVIAFLETILANCVSVYIINSKLPKPLLSSEYNNTIWKILGCCFLAESISMVILSILFPVILGESIKYAVQNSVILLIYMITTGTDYSNLQSILFTISTIFLSSVIIFLLCRFFIFKNLDLLEKKKRYSLHPQISTRNKRNRNCAAYATAKAQAKNKISCQMVFFFRSASKGKIQNLHHIKL